MFSDCSYANKNIDIEFSAHTVVINTEKTDSRGLARCEVCNKEINYAGTSLEQHLKKKLHIDNLKIKRTNYSLSVMYHCIPFILSFLQGGVFF